MNIQDIFRGLPFPMQGALMQAFGATANQQPPQQDAGGGRGFVNPPQGYVAPQGPGAGRRIPGPTPIQVPKDEAGFEDVIARIMAGGSTDELQNAPAAAAAAPAVTPVQQAMEPDVPAPAASDAAFESALKGSQEAPASGGILKMLDNAVGFSQPDFIGRLGTALAVAGSQDPAKALMQVQQNRAEEAKIAEARRQRMIPKIVGSAGPNGAIQLVQMPDGSIVPRTLDQVMQMNKEIKNLDFRNDVDKAIAIETAKDKIRTVQDDRKRDADGATERVQAGLSVQQLNQIADSLEKTDTATGPVLGLLPKMLRDVITPQGASLQDSAERIVQGGLRATLGGQFTQAEGDRFLARAYNPRLDEKQNAANMRTIAREIAAMQLDKKNALAYFQANGTLEGFVPNANPGAAPAPAGGVSRPASKADFDALPKGSRFIAPDGKEYIK
jgi:hypothetical protein